MHRILLLAGALLALVPGCRAEPVASAQAEAPALVPLTIDSRRGPRTFRVEVARTELQQERGLMFRTSLPDRGGMIFPLTPPRPATFWMKNTPLSLDIVFVRENGTIARIVENTTPMSEDLIPSGEPVRAVLEVKAGTMRQLGVTVGDRLRNATYFP